MSPPHGIIVGVDFGSGSGLYQFVTAQKTGKPSLIPYVLHTSDAKTLRVIDTAAAPEETFFLMQEEKEAINVYQQ